MRILVLLALSVLGATPAAAGPEIGASASVLWTRNRPAMEHKIYGYAGPLDLGIALRRGQLRRTTRLDARVGLRVQLEPWLTVRAALQVGSLSPDPPCRTDCVRWEDFDYSGSFFAFAAGKFAALTGISRGGNRHLRRWEQAPTPKMAPPFVDFFAQLG